MLSILDVAILHMYAGVMGKLEALDALAAAEAASLESGTGAGESNTAEPESGRREHVLPGCINAVK